jgi:hypothetical protein
MNNPRLARLTHPKGAPKQFSSLVNDEFHENFRTVMPPPLSHAAYGRLINWGEVAPAPSTTPPRMAY